VTLSDNQKNPLLQNLVGEHYRSLQVLGVPKERVILGQFETRRFPQFRQEILAFMLNIRNEFNPDIVFVHTKSDLHQDHATVTEEGLRAFRGTTVLGYDVIRSSYGFFPHFLVEVDETDVQKKIQALGEYHTYADKYYFDADLTRSILVKTAHWLNENLPKVLTSCVSLEIRLLKKISIKLDEIFFLFWNADFQIIFNNTNRVYRDSGHSR